MLKRRTEKTAKTLQNTYYKLLEKKGKNTIPNWYQIKPTFWMHALHKWHGQFRGTQFLIFVLNCLRVVEFLYSLGKIIHICDPQTKMVSVP